MSKIILSNFFLFKHRYFNPRQKGLLQVKKFLIKHWISKNKYCIIYSSNLNWKLVSKLLRSEMVEVSDFNRLVLTSFILSFNDLVKRFPSSNNCLIVCANWTIRKYTKKIIFTIYKVRKCPTLKLTFLSKKRLTFTLFLIFKWVISNVLCFWV